MGCDIHCYIEYKNPERDDWRDFGGRINPGRNYWMFGFMAGVRLEDVPHIEPRGRAKDAAYEARSNDQHYIDDKLEDGAESVDGEYHYSRKRADEYVAKGYCEYTDERKMFVTDCDHHTHSWLNADEFELALAAYLKKCGFQINTLRLPAPAEMSTALSTYTEDQRSSLEYITEYWAILAAMRCFEAQGLQSRLVFWFDN